MAALTLLRQKSPLAEAKRQVEILESVPETVVPHFDKPLADHRVAPLTARDIEVLQINVGKLCNQTCHHCHVDAGPDRREAMSQETADHCLRVLGESGIPTLDITGGAPEMNPNFRRLVREARRMGRRVIDRCNLTILRASGFHDLPEFLAEHEVEVVASLPCYVEENCDAQRGGGVFRRSIEALQRLNELGYGQPDSSLTLTLVYNPVGPSLPPNQAELEQAYRRELRSRYGIEFSHLFTITNLPISRFLVDLLQTGQYEAYLQKLAEAFNPAAIDGLMCRTMLSVDWQGNLYDCDFNQMLERGLTSGLPKNICQLDQTALQELGRRRIVTGRHCFGCTAGAGSSCQGSLSE